MQSRRAIRPRLVAGVLVAIALVSAGGYGISWFLGEQKRMVHKITTAPPSRSPLHVGDEGAGKLGLSVPPTPASPLPPPTAPLRRKAGVVDIEATPEFDPGKIARTAVILNAGNASPSGRDLRSAVAEALGARGYTIASDSEVLPVVEAMTARIEKERRGRTPEILSSEASEIARELVVPAVVFVEKSSTYTSGPPPAPIRMQISMRFIPNDSSASLWEARWTGTARRSTDLHRLHLQALELIAAELPCRLGFTPPARPGR